MYYYYHAEVFMIAFVALRKNRAVYEPVRLTNDMTSFFLAHTQQRQQNIEQQVGYIITYKPTLPNLITNHVCSKDHKDRPC